jgi:cell division septal protein FtsQ
MTDLEMQQMARNVRAIRNVQLAPALAGATALAVVLVPVLVLAVLAVFTFVTQAVLHALTW